MQTKNNNREADAPRQIQITETTTKNIFNENNNPFANNCRLSPELCFLISKVS